ncbi:monovalent cation/H+ antiporter subunit D family protein [Microbacterium imperiale]|uniref:Cation:proton antiporter n=1 Tax=Microbacterium imperiale TaxID=33884 RepID=A0A9W6HI65_9MICO|nr:monovalent cation/H+ antiporter subunit D family protein [Microbacterium imperiale]MBP2421301.1 multicomponent Na+:H+ antiporter subunit D [Microbacterium imperiale]MDS0199589.1 monovalent cation/H+ antiporter subunit D family protein [Microbacterium imperiale]BFE41641.1 monovalent cation/H+ antiporter subunit D family protein [Microbacterium imperiale]GLJ80591.1 cation:proton antiporter [Microbacterium imperiale]
MNASLLPLIVAIPLLAAGVAAFARRDRPWSRVLLLTVLTGNIVAAVALVVATADGSVLAHGVGGWPNGIAIPFVADALSALMLTVAGALTLVCVVFAIIADTGRHRLFAALVLVLTAGVNGALLTADLFNLFVFIEVMLLPSYGLLVLARQGRGTVESVTGSRLYVTFNLFVSTVFLAGVALVYGVAGTVNLAELAGAAQESGLVAAALGVCLFALAMKAAVVPVHGWLARAYPSTSPAITALFSGLHTKVAIYAIYRIYAVGFEGDRTYLWIGIVAFSATMAVGVLGAVGESRMRSVLAFHMVSQIGYILLGVALFTPLGLAAGIFYLLHHMIVKASLFLSAGAIETRFGTDRLDELRGRIGREPVLMVAFGVAALSLAGIPPFSGFFAKLTLLMAAIDAGEIAAAVVAIAVSLITLLSMLKIFNAVFAPTVTGLDPQPSGTAAVAVRERAATRTSLAAPALVLAGVTVALGFGAQGLFALAEVAAAGLLDTSGYVRAVLP